MKAVCKGFPTATPLTALPGWRGKEKFCYLWQKDKDSSKIWILNGNLTQKQKSSHCSAARNGDEEAMESLTMEDMDTIFYDFAENSHR